MWVFFNRVLLLLEMKDSFVGKTLGEDMGNLGSFFFNFGSATDFLCDITQVL